MIAENFGNVHIRSTVLLIWYCAEVNNMESVLEKLSAILSTPT
jgi:hypothetical protein